MNTYRYKGEGVNMEGIVKHVSIYGLIAVIFYVGYLFYDKNFLISIGLVFFGIIFTFIVILYENER